jgi:hypothetical protein
MSLDGSPAIHQSTHLGQEDLSFLSGSGSFMGAPEEPLPLGSAVTSWSSLSQASATRWSAASNSCSLI